jgi:hypothetical protein
VRNPCDGLLAIGVRPPARDLHRAAVKVPHDDATCVP